MISEYKTISYNLENTENLTIAELIVRLKELPQEHLCNDYYLTFTGNIEITKEGQIEECRKRIENLTGYLQSNISSADSYKTQIQLLEIKLKELESDDETN